MGGGNKETNKELDHSDGASGEFINMGGDNKSIAKKSNAPSGEYMGMQIDNKFSFVPPNADYDIKDIEKLHKESIAEKKEAGKHSYNKEYDPKLKGTIVFRCDTRLPDEIFHLGFTRHLKIAQIAPQEPQKGTVVIKGVVSTTTDVEVAYRVVEMAHRFLAEKGFIYAIQLNNSGGKSVPTTVTGRSLSEIASLYVPPEDIAFAIGPIIETQEKNRHSATTGELIINPHSTVSTASTVKAYEELRNHLLGKYKFHPDMTFEQRYEARKLLFNHESEFHLSEPHLPERFYHDYHEELADKYDRHIIVQMDNKEASAQAAKLLFDKYPPDKVILLQWNALTDDFIASLNLTNLDSLLLVGHGNGMDTHAEATLAGMNAAQLGEHLLAMGLKDTLPRAHQPTGLWVSLW